MPILGQYRNGLDRGPISVEDENQRVRLDASANDSVCTAFSFIFRKDNRKMESLLRLCCTSHRVDRQTEN